MPCYRINFKTGSHYFLSANVISFVPVNITLLKKKFLCKTSEPRNMFLPLDLSVGYNYISTTDVIH